MGSTKYDPDLLKQDVTLAKSRVARLKRELEQIGAEMTHKERGVETLSNVGEKLSTLAGGYSLEQAQRILAEIRQLQSRLTHGEKEKNDLMQVGRRLLFFVFCFIVFHHRWLLAFKDFFLALHQFNGKCL